MSEAVVHIERVEQRQGGKSALPLSPRAPVPGARTRTCVGCGERVDLLGDQAADLLRLVFGPDGTVIVDAGNGGSGRGAHVHARGPCLERAARGGLARSAKAHITTILTDEGPEPLSAAALARTIQRSMARRTEGFFAAAVRSRRLAHGADAVAGACERGEAALVVVACDAAAGAAADLAEVRRAIAEGRAVAWGSPQRLGRLISGKISEKLRAPVPVNGSGAEAPPVDVVAITSRQLAEAMRRTVQVADACTAIATGSPPKGGGRPRAGTVPERSTRGSAPAGTPGKRRGQRAFPSASAGHAKNHRSDG